MLSFSGAAASHPGLVRANNEDSGVAGPALLAVADGVGGAAAGEVASATAVHVLAGAVTGTTHLDPARALRDGVRLAQERVALGVARDPARAGMATTLTAVLGDGERFALLHLGDSRGYVLREGSLTRVTRDHSFVQELLDAGQLDESERDHHPWRHVVTRILAGDPAETGDVTRLDLRAGDRVLVCSDGLTDLVGEPDLERVLTTHPDDAGAVDALVAAALAAGGRDNVTCLLATVVQGVPWRTGSSLVGAARDPRLVVDAGGVRLPRSA